MYWCFQINNPVYHCYKHTIHFKEPGLSFQLICDWGSSILHYGPLKETNNLHAPTPNGNVRVRRKMTHVSNVVFQTCHRVQQDAKGANTTAPARVAVFVTASLPSWAENAEKHDHERSNVQAVRVFVDLWKSQIFKVRLRLDSVIHILLKEPMVRLKERNIGAKTK